MNQKNNYSFHKGCPKDFSPDMSGCDRSALVSFRLPHTSMEVIQTMNRIEPAIAGFMI